MNHRKPLILFSFMLLVAAAQHRPLSDEWQSIDESLAQPSMKSDRPTNGFVPDERTAVRIAEAVAAALYGEQKTASERPFHGRLKGGVWTVKGTLTPPGAYGGTAVIQINKIDGRVLFAVHQH